MPLIRLLQGVKRPALARPLPGRALLVGLALAIVCALHLLRGVSADRLSHTALDQVQAARYTAATGHLFTLVLRPLDAGRLESNPDGALPDFGHPPLYTALCAAAIRLTRDLGPAGGARGAAALGAVLLTAAVALTLLLAQTFFPRRGGGRAAVLAALGGGGLALAGQASPALLSALLLGALCLALFALDRRLLWEERPPLRAALAAGALAGLLTLSAYSTLLLVPLFVWHVWRIAGGDRRCVAAFVMALGVTLSPMLWRAARATGNPLYHARLVEAAMDTPTFPGDQLYRTVGSPRPLPAYLASGGLVETARKTGRNLSALLPAAAATIGPVVLLLFAGSALLRFADIRVNALRNLLLMALPLHALGLSVFLGPDEAAGALWMYALPAAALGAGFVETAIDARRPSRWHGAALRAGWTLLGALPGLALLLAGPARPRPVSGLYDFLVRADRDSFPRLRERRDGVLAASDPVEAAFWLDVPVTALPPDAAQFRALSARLSRPIAGVLLTRALRATPPDDRAARPWVETYERGVGLWYVLKGLPRAQRARVAETMPVRFPPAIAPAVEGFVPRPFLEEVEGGYSLVFWRPEFLGGGQGKGDALSQ